MLDWMNLTARQRWTALGFADFALVASVIPVMAVLQGVLVLGMREVLAAFAVSTIMLGTLLNPDAVRGEAGAVNPLSAPPICKVLYGAGVAAFLARAALGILGIG